MSVNIIDELIRNFELAEIKLIGLLADCCEDAEVHRADKELTSAFSALLDANPPEGEMRLQRIEFLLQKLVGEQEPGSLNNRLREIILSDISEIAFQKVGSIADDCGGLEIS